MTTTKATQWSLTINNPTPQDYTNITEAQQKGWKITGQQEVGDNQTHHLQLYLKTPHIRFSAVKKQFPRAHIEVARNPIALQQYVVKTDTRVGELPETNNQALYPNIEELYRRYAKEYYWDDYIEERIDNGNYDAPLHTKLNKLTQDGALHQWRYYLACQIKLGNHIDQLAVNPQVISFVKTYHTSIVYRALDQLYDKIYSQTSGQTDTRSNNTNITDDTEHNNGINQENNNNN